MGVGVHWEQWATGGGGGYWGTLGHWGGGHWEGVGRGTLGALGGRWSGEHWEDTGSTGGASAAAAAAGRGRWGAAGGLLFRPARGRCNGEGRLCRSSRWLRRSRQAVKRDVIVAAALTLDGGQRRERPVKDGGGGCGSVRRGRSAGVRIAIASFVATKAEPCRSGTCSGSWVSM